MGKRRKTRRGALDRSAGEGQRMEGEGCTEVQSAAGAISKRRKQGRLLRQKEQIIILHLKENPRSEDREFHSTTFGEVRPLKTVEVISMLHDLAETEVGTWAI